GRECSISEIKAIRENTQKELEVFVHGALCVAYSGQCFTSEALGGRSANRGQCAQSCRLEYELIVDGVKTTSHKGAYAVSPKDLMGLEHIPTLQEIGVESFKVEGRLKGPDYVASVARHYKDAIIKKSVSNIEQKKKELARTYSRGFFTGWLGGVHHQSLVDGSYSNHRGQLIGKVLKIDQRQVFISTKEDVQNGVGLLFAGDSKSELGSFVYKVTKQKDQSLAIELARGFDLSKIKIGHNVFLNKDPALEKDLAKSWKDKEQFKKIKLTLKVDLRAGRLANVIATDEDGNTKTFASQQKLEEAKQNPATKTDIEKGLGGFGATAFEVELFNIQMDSNLFIPNQMLKSIRKEIASAMEKMRTQVAQVEFLEPTFPDIETRFDLNPKTNVLLRD
ncbi:MAG: collagenase, partial [Halobacteriovorax sp.]|nr:collagenase [Halobacteriovorax sp.]